MSDNWVIQDRIATQDDWLAGSPYTINLCDTSYVEAGSTLIVQENNGVVSISLQQNSGLMTGPGDILTNGQLTVSATLPVATVSASGQEYPAGTQLMLVFTMVFATEDGGPGEEQHITGLTLLDDPDNAGVMGGASGGGP